MGLAALPGFIQIKIQILVAAEKNLKMCLLKKPFKMHLLKVKRLQPIR